MPGYIPESIAPERCFLIDSDVSPVLANGLTVEQATYRAVERMIQMIRAEWFAEFMEGKHGGP